jgi:hypothetical protein
MKTERIEKILAECDGSPKGIQEAANRILMEETDISVGSTVAVVDETVAMGMVGKGKVKSFSDNKQYANVVFDDGREVPVLTNSLYLVGKA